MAIGCRHSPKPWRMPMLGVTTAALHGSTCVIDSRSRGAARFIAPLAWKTLAVAGRPRS